MLKKSSKKFTVKRRKNRKLNQLNENQNNNKEANRAVEVKIKPLDHKNIREFAIHNVILNDWDWESENKSELELILQQTLENPISEKEIFCLIPIQDSINKITQKASLIKKLLTEMNTTQLPRIA